jgi:hypothetical protein
MKTTDTFFIRGLFFLYVNFTAHSVFADNCPSVKDITYRLISKDYEWTVDEGVTLENLLSVEELFAVNIENNGEFVSCNYKNDEKILKLDGLPIKEKCPLINSSGNWINTDTNRLVCDEEDLSLCLFDTDCSKEKD